MKKTIICIISFLILFMVGGCKKNGEVPHIIDNDTEREYSIDENLIFDFPDQYNVVDGRVTFDCKVIAPDVSQVKEYTAMKKELDREYLNNIIESKIVIDTYEEYETYDGDVSQHIDSGDISITITRDSLLYNNSRCTTGLDEAFKINELDVNSNIDKFLTDKELNFASRDDVKEMLYGDLGFIGLNDNDLDIHLYVCDIETLESEYSIDEEYYEFIGQDPDDNELFEGYYLCARQTLDNVPVFTQIAGVMYQDIEGNSPITAYYTADGVQYFDAGDLYDFEETGNVQKLLTFEEVAQILSDHYNYYITNDMYLVYSAKLYNYVKKERDNTYSVTPVWIFKTYVTDVNGMVSQKQFEINAVTGEVFERD